MTFRRFSSEIIVPAAHLWGRLMLRLMGVRLTVEGFEFMQERRARVVVFNHQGALDLFWVPIIAPPGSFIVAKKELRWVPGFNIAIWGSRSIFVDRANREQALRSLAHVERRLTEEQATIIMAPEGTRTLDGRIREFKKGPFRIALQAGAPICPVVVRGAYELLPKGRAVPKRGEIRVRCLPPIDTTDWSLENLEEKIAEVRALMIAECGSVGPDECS